MEFIKDDYIVTLNVRDGYNCAKNNYCFKQRRNSTFMQPCMDLAGSLDNGHTIMSYDKQHTLKDWRYATDEEIEEYDRLREPYDVTTLVPKINLWEPLPEEDKKLFIKKVLGALYTDYSLFKKIETLINKQSKQTS